MARGDGEGFRRPQLTTLDAYLVIISPSLAMAVKANVLKP